MIAIRLGDHRRVVASAAVMSSLVDGEVLGATRAVCRLLAKHALEPAGVIGRGLSPLPTAEPCEVPVSMPRRWSVMRLLDWEVKARDLLSAPGLLTAWERQFVESISKRVDPTSAQLATLDRIAADVTARRGEGGHASCG